MSYYNQNPYLHRSYVTPINSCASSADVLLAYILLRDDAVL